MLEFTGLLTGFGFVVMLYARHKQKREQKYYRIKKERAGITDINNRDNLN